MDFSLDILQRLKPVGVCQKLKEYNHEKKNVIVKQIEYLVQNSL